MNQKTARAKTSAQGRKFVRLIMNRRLAKCIRAQRHTTGHCNACGVHQ